MPVLCGCTSWYATRLTPEPEHEDRTMQVWLGDSAVVLEHATIRADSLHGQRRVGTGAGIGRAAAIPLARVDSLRVRSFDPGKTGLLLLGALPAAFSMLFVLDEWLK